MKKIFKAMLSSEKCTSSTIHKNSSTSRIYDVMGKPAQSCPLSCYLLVPGIMRSLTHGFRFGLKAQTLPTLVFWGLAARLHRTLLKRPVYFSSTWPHSGQAFGSNPSPVNTDSVWETAVRMSPQRITDAVRPELHAQTFDAF